ncbi:response regulator transcription factor [Mediterraneibacter gnavus]|uniref:response regulator transcription factor n=1 Tax=Mediterraneibacter gnavus TaxID=33038 RepID=UPI00232E10D1|nr:response regulator transcription factor [Mediterraneibacter gnavus]MDB8710914.1 response regulator transcription factor [Mediterraneibacter gnavus]MDB8714190.1 response regulator transcription factor [Mediterraneibacter gnavus]
MKLLLVEDDIEISQMLKSYLEAENYEVICAVDGEEACEKFEKESLMIGNLTINLMNYTVEKNGTKIDLTAKEFEILKLLVQNPQKVYTKEQMYSLIWNDAYLGDENAVNVHISRLRNKIEEHPRSPKYIITVWGIGYKLGDLS